MSFIVTLAFFKDITRTKVETVVADGAISAMRSAENENPGWISVSAELDNAA